MLQFYQDTKKKRTGKMRLQTDQEFQQTNIKKLNKEYDVEMYSIKLRGGKAFAAEQKLCELKKLLLRSKRIQELLGKRVKSNELIIKVTFNLNNINSARYGYARKKQRIRASIKKLVKIFKKFTALIDYEELKKPD